MADGLMDNRDWATRGSILRQYGLFSSRGLGDGNNMLFMKKKLMGQDIGLEKRNEKEY